MTSQLEQLGSLQRRLSLAVPLVQVEQQVAKRLRDISRTAKLPGFRPGKVPMRMVTQSYGAQVQSEVLGDSVSKVLTDAITELKLRVAGQPSIERKEGGPETEFGFTATFEVYPEVQVGDVSSLKLERIACEVTDSEVDRTLEVLRKQRTTWTDSLENAKDGDRVTMDFAGTLDGIEFEGGKAQDFPFELGQGRMLPDFESGVRGAANNDIRRFDVGFPADYGSKDLAGKTAQFEVRIKKIESPVLPALDAEFAKQLGVADGDLAKMRAEVRSNIEREVSQRTRQRTKNMVLDSLPVLAEFELPQSLIQNESATLAERTKADLQARGVDVSKMPVPVDAFKEQAEKRVRLGLLVSEIVKQHSLQPKPDQIRKQIEEMSQGYENPGEVIRYYFSDKQRLAEVEAVVTEQNVVEWALNKAQVTDKQIAFDELMQNR
jgi:trigger factor